MHILYDAKSTIERRIVGVLLLAMIRTRPAGELRPAKTHWKKNDTALPRGRNSNGPGAVVKAPGLLIWPVVILPLEYKAACQVRSSSSSKATFSVKATSERCCEAGSSMTRPAPR